MVCGQNRETFIMLGVVEGSEERQTMLGPEPTDDLTDDEQTVARFLRRKGFDHNSFNIGTAANGERINIQPTATTDLPREQWSLFAESVSVFGFEASSEMAHVALKDVDVLTP